MTSVSVEISVDANDELWSMNGQFDVKKNRYCRSIWFVGIELVNVGSPEDTSMDTVTEGGDG